jgi:tRNA pseudouridine38-40 synthase
MPRYFVRLAFRGTRYSGWQLQENAISVQEKLNDALTVLCGYPILTTGCGRTDTGVHAREFYAHCDCDEAGPKFLHQLNAILPDDIAVYSILPVHPHAHARFDAISRTYKYYITLIKDPFLKDLAMFGHFNADLELMNEACISLMSFRDFSSFSKSNTQVKTNICTISSAGWSQADNTLIFTITADRFLRGMVRAVVGTLIGVGSGKISVDQFKDIIMKGDRKAAGMSVPACGLYLTSVTYPYPVTTQHP